MTSASNLTACTGKCATPGGVGAAPCEQLPGEMGAPNFSESLRSNDTWPPLVVTSVLLTRRSMSFFSRVRRKEWSALPGRHVVNEARQGKTNLAGCHIRSFMDGLDGRCAKKVSRPSVNV